MSIELTQNQKERESRRLIERLSGWRMVTFFVSMALNLLCLGVLSSMLLVLDPRWQSLLFALVAAQSALFATAIGAFRFRFHTQFSLLTLHLVACLWTIAQFTAMSFSHPKIIEVFFVLATQAVLLCGSTSLIGRYQKSRFAIGMYDLLIITTVVAAAIPICKFWIPNWIEIWTTDTQTISEACMRGLINAFWCLALLSMFVDGTIPMKFSERNIVTRLWQMMLFLIVASFLETLLNTGSKSPYLAAHRIVFLGWLAISMIPVIGLVAEPRQNRWISTTEFYRRVQGSQRRRESSLKAKPPLTQSSSVSIVAVAPSATGRKPVNVLPSGLSRPSRTE